MYDSKFILSAIFLTTLVVIGCFTSTTPTTVDPAPIDTTTIPIDTVPVVIDTIPSDTLVVDTIPLKKYCFEKIDSLDIAVTNSQRVHFNALKEMVDAGEIQSQRYQDTLFGLEKIKGQLRAINNFKGAAFDNCVPENFAENQLESAERILRTATDRFKSDPSIQHHKEYQRALALKVTVCRLYGGICE